MDKTLRISFGLRNTYRVNAILYSFRQIPIIKKLLPDTLYQVRALKIFANVLSALWEVITVFLWKILYFALMVAGAAALYEGADEKRLFLHLLVFLTILGGFVNGNIFMPSRDKYYAMILLRMDAKRYTLVNYVYMLVKFAVGYVPVVLWFGMGAGLEMWQCLLLAAFAVGTKLTVMRHGLRQYRKKGTALDSKKDSYVGMLEMAALFAAAYGLPALGVLLPVSISVVVCIVFTVTGIVSVWDIWKFDGYFEMYREILFDFLNQTDSANTMVRDQTRKKISVDARITSSRSGFEYLNELFIKRHRRILWKSSVRIALVCAVIAVGLAVAAAVNPDAATNLNRMILVMLPYFVFIMYAINRGTSFTQALFMNCDHSLLTYAFYKQPAQILKLFQIRLRELVKINLLPAFVIGAGLCLLLFASGGAANITDYAVLFVSVICMSIFFSVHYLTIYYLLQPYNAGTEMKSGTYQIVLSVTYFVCFLMMQLRLPIFVFGLLTIVFCVLYCIAACFLVYKFAPKTFRLRN